MDVTARPFQGDKKLPLRSPLAKAERRLIDFLTPRFPRWIEGYHLTLLTIPWSAGLILSGYLARWSLHWLWLASLMLAVVVFRTQKYIWRIDMEDKRRRQ